MLPTHRVLLAALLVLLCVAVNATDLVFKHGSSVLKSSSAVSWSTNSTLAAQGASLVTYELCASQRHFATKLRSARFSTGQAKVSFPLCTSIAKCRNSTAMFSVDGLYCRTGSYPLHVLYNETAVAWLAVMDRNKGELARFQTP